MQIFYSVILIFLLSVTGRGLFAVPRPIPDRVLADVPVALPTTVRYAGHVAENPNVLRFLGDLSSVLQSAAAVAPFWQRHHLFGTARKVDSEKRTFEIVLVDEEYPGLEATETAGIVAKLTRDGSVYRQTIELVLRVDKIFYRSNGEMREAASACLFAGIVTEAFGHASLLLEKPISQLWAFGDRGWRRFDEAVLREKVRVLEKLLLRTELAERAGGGILRAQLFAALYDTFRKLDAATGGYEGIFSFPFQLNLSKRSMNALSPAVAEEAETTVMLAISLVRALHAGSPYELVRNDDEAQRRTWAARLQFELNVFDLSDREAASRHPQQFVPEFPLSRTHTCATPGKDSGVRVSSALVTRWGLYDAQKKVRPEALALLAMSLAGDIFTVVSDRLSPEYRDTGGKQREVERLGASAEAGLAFAVRLVGRPMLWNLLTDAQKRGFAIAEKIFENNLRISKSCIPRIRRAGTEKPPEHGTSAF